MATASDYWSLFSNAFRALAGDWFAVGTALAKLYDIADEQSTSSPARAGAAQQVDEVGTAYRQGVVHLGIARRAAEAGERPAARVAAGNAQEAFVTAVVKAEQRSSDPAQAAEIMAQIGACSAAMGSNLEARHWMELAYRSVLPSVASRRALPAVERQRLERFLPPLGDALARRPTIADWPARQRPVARTLDYQRADRVRGPAATA